jgi:hypothetical protein
VEDHQTARVWLRHHQAVLALVVELEVVGRPVMAAAALVVAQGLALGPDPALVLVPSGSVQPSVELVEPLVVEPIHPVASPAEPAAVRPISCQSST